MVDIPGAAYWRAQRDQRMVGNRPAWELEELRAMIQLVRGPVPEDAPPPRDDGRASRKGGMSA